MSENFMAQARGDAVAAEERTNAERARRERATPNRVRHLWRQYPLLIILVVIWLLLWDAPNLLTVIAGMVLAVGVTRVFYLPPIALSGRTNWWRVLVLLVSLAWDITRASFLVAWQAVDWRYHPTNSVIAVHLNTASDLIVALTSEAISLVPGTVVLEVDRERAIIYVHALGTADAAEVEDVRRSVLRTEEYIVRAIGTWNDVASVREERDRLENEARIRREGGAA